MLELPPGVRVLERGWLSANNILLVDDERAVLVDTGYWTHSGQTLELVGQALGGRPLDLLINTHLHSDHCGGNAAVQSQYGKVQTWVPPGLAEAVRQWDPVALTYTPTGQHCPRFKLDGVIEPGTSLVLAGRDWDVHAAPGHDPHSVILFEPRSRVLISADALWRNGFGVVFPELDGVSAFAEVEETLALIERLQPDAVIPGHGGVFTEVSEALELAKRRLESFRRDPVKHAIHAAKVLIKFKLLEVQQLTPRQLLSWVSSSAYFSLVHARYFADEDLQEWVWRLVAELERSGAAARSDSAILNA